VTNRPLKLARQERQSTQEALEAKVKIAVIIPADNEESTKAKAIREHRAALPTLSNYSPTILASH